MSVELNQDHISVGERLEHVRFQQLREFGHRPEYVDVKAVPSESSDKTYLVGRLKCLSGPFGDETDVVADQIETLVCSCDDFWFRCSGGFEDGENPPAKWDRCKHCRAAFRAEKAQSDDQQTQLK